MKAENVASYSQGLPRTGQNGFPELVIEYVRISELRPKPENPRAHTPTQLRRLKASINQFGFITPLVVDESGQILIGEARWLAARDLGMTEVPVISITHLNPNECKALVIADNRLAELATWDDKKLALLLNDLTSAGIDFDVQVTGFDMGEIDLRIESLKLESNGPGAEDDIPALLPGPSVTSPGDVWLLGPHRILCGNSLNASSYETLMRGETASIVFADPPYNVPIEGHAVGNGSVHHREFAMAVGEMTSAQFECFLSGYMALVASHSRAGSLHFHCMDWRHSSEILAAGARRYATLMNIAVWVKHNAGMGSLYRSQHEFVFVFKNGRTAHQNHVQLGRFGRNRSNVWNYAGANSFGRAGDEGNLLALHPTVKPVGLIVDALLDCSARGDIVLDPFLGSGSTLIAAERTGRRCFGIELDCAYVDTAIRRYQAHSGEEVRHATTGRLFCEIDSETRNG